MSNSKNSSENPIDIIRSIKRDGICPSALLIVAPDEIRKRRACEMLTSELLPKEQSDCLARLDAEFLDQKKLQSFIDSVSSISLFSPFRIFIIRNIDELHSSLSEKLINFLKSDLQGVCCIFLASKLPATSSILKHFKSKKTAIVLPALEGPELMNWAQKELKNNGITECEPEALRLMLDSGENSPDKIAQHISHLALYSDSSKVSLADARALFSASADASEYDFIDNLMAKNSAKAESLMQVILDSGKSPFLVISLLQRTFSTYLSIAALLKEGRSSSEIAAKLRLPPWLLNKHLGTVRRYSVAQLKHCLSSVLRADSKLKNRSLGTESIFSEFVYNVTRSV